jgi:RNA polymerase sigma-70 factor (sigma-E family)
MPAVEEPGPVESGADPPRPQPPVDPDIAITELYAAHWHRLVRLAWLLLHDQLAAEDVVQDAFVATHRHWSMIRDTGRAVGYLQVAVVNGCRSVQRHGAVVDRENARQASAADAPARSSLDSAETQVLHTSERDGLMTVLRSLPHRQREVLVLRYYADLSEVQIATALEISTGSVKAHAHRGLMTLRERMARPPTVADTPRPSASPDAPEPPDPTEQP